VAGRDRRLRRLLVHECERERVLYARGNANAVVQRGIVLEAQERFLGRLVKQRTGELDSLDVSHSAIGSYRATKDDETLNLLILENPRVLGGSSAAQHGLRVHRRL